MGGVIQNFPYFLVAFQQLASVGGILSRKLDKHKNTGRPKSDSL